MKSQLMEKMAGEITLSPVPGKTIRKWREDFQVSQQDLAKHLDISPSVISDYEGGRRKSPGIRTIKRIVTALLEIDEERGGKKIKQFTVGEESDAILSIREFPIGLTFDSFLNIIGGEGVIPNCEMKPDIHGYTVIDSLKAITSFESRDYMKVYGWSSERALIFTGVKFGRSPMIAIRAHPMKPAVVVYQRPEHIDPLAIRLSELEKVPLVKTEMHLESLIETLEQRADRYLNPPSER